MSTSQHWTRLLPVVLPAVLLACSHGGRPLGPGAGAEDGGELDGGAPPAPIADLVARLDAAAPGEASAVVQTWLETQPRIPIVDGTTALFLWQGEEPDVRLVGDMNGWDPAAGPGFVPVPHEGAGLQYLEQTYETDARLDYKIVVGGNQWNLDPLNPRKMVGGYGPNSELAMPEYVTPADALTEGPPQGTLAVHAIESQALGESRSITVYVPPGSAVPGPRPLVVFHDGGDYLNIIQTRGILDHLVETSQVGPLVAVFVSPRNRNVEYDRNDAYVRFLADEVLPFVQETYQAGLTPETTGTIGPSMGGLIACYTAFSRPDAFGLAGCQSGAYTLHDDAFIRQVREMPKVDARFHLTMGTYELSVGGGGPEGNLLEGQRRLVQVLKEKGYAFESEEHPQGHSWGQWRDTLPAILRDLYGR